MLTTNDQGFVQNPEASLAVNENSFMQNQQTDHPGTSVNDDHFQQNIFTEDNGLVNSECNTNFTGCVAQQEANTEATEIVNEATGGPTINTANHCSRV